MKSDEFIELVNKEISGEMTTQESARLERYLKDNPQARKTRRELHEATDLLGQVGDIEPPPHLKRHIMNSVDFSRYRRQEKRPVLGFFGRVRGLGFRPRFAYAFAAGVAVGLAVFYIALSGSWEAYSPDLSGLYAAIGVSKDANFRSIERLPLDLPEAQGHFDLIRSGDLLICEVSLASTNPYEVRVLYDPAEVLFNGFRPEAGSRSLTEVGEGRLSASGSGEGRFLISLTKVTESALPIDMELVISGKVLLSHRFEVGPRDDRKQ